MNNTAQNTATAQEREARLAALVRDLSGRWPHLLGAARPSELPITPTELGTVLATWMEADFNDALLGTDWAALRTRAAMPVTTDAVMGVGALIVTQIESAVREQLLREVQIHRDFCDRLRHEVACEREPRRETDESYYGVASVWGAR